MDLLERGLYWTTSKLCKCISHGDSSQQQHATAEVRIGYEKGVDAGAQEFSHQSKQPEVRVDAYNRSDLDKAYREANVVGEAGGDDTIFPFFDLPAELREMIYSHISTVKCGTPHQDQYGMDIFVRSPVAHSYRISKRFNDELTEHVALARDTCLTVEDNLLPLTIPYPVEPLINPDMHYDIHRVEAFYDGRDCFAADWEDKVCGDTCCALVRRFSLHIKFALDRITMRLPNVEYIRITLYVCCPADDRSGWPVSQHGPGLQRIIESLTTFHGMSELRVYKYFPPLAAIAKSRCKEVATMRWWQTSVRAKQSLWVSWSKETGWQLPEESASLEHESAKE